MTFGQLLRTTRKQARLNQRDLAEQVGCDFTYLSKIENDRMPPPSSTLTRRLAEALESDPAEFWRVAGNTPTAELLVENEQLRTALQSIGEFALTHHADQPENEWLHALTVDIPDMCERAMGPDAVLHREGAEIVLE